MAENKKADINACMWPYYDPSLLLKILDFYLAKATHDKPKLLEQKLKILSCTMMNTAARSVYKELYGHENYPASYDEHLKKVNDKKAALEKGLEKALAFLRSEEVVNMLKEEKLFNMSYIKSNFSFDDKQLDMLLEYAKLLYDCGQYSGMIFDLLGLQLKIDALNLLYFFRRLSNNKEKNISALWGQLGGYILLGQSDKAFETFVKLKDNVDSLVLFFFQGCSNRKNLWIVSSNGSAECSCLALTLEPVPLFQHS